MKKNPLHMRVTSGALLALGLAVTGGTIAGAATGTTTTSQASGSAPTGAHHDPLGGPSGGQRPAAVGTVASVGTDSFTLTTQDGSTVTVDTNSSTTYLTVGSSSSTSSVADGTKVAVFGTESGTTVSATKVIEGLPTGAPGQGGPSGGAPGMAGGASSASATA